MVFDRRCRSVMMVYNLQSSYKPKPFDRTPAYFDAWIY